MEPTIAVVTQLARRVVVRSWIEKTAAISCCRGGALRCGHKLIKSKMQRVTDIELTIYPKAASTISLPIALLTVRRPIVSRIAIR